MAAGRKIKSTITYPQNRKKPGKKTAVSQRNLGIASESPQFGSTIEWWFVHGSFDAPCSGRQYFLATIFRYTVSQKKKNPSDGYYLILSMLNPATGQHDVVSRGEQEALKWIVSQKKKKNRKSNLDPCFIDTYLDELRSYGPPSPLSLEQKRASVSLEPFSICWKDFLFSQSESRFHVAFDAPVSQVPCCFSLTPVSPRGFIDGTGSSFQHRMAYSTYPRLQLNGTYGNEEVCGTAWLDHQWGNTSWFLSQQSGGNVYGWDWVGMNGDDGSDWIIFISRDMQSEKVVGQFIAVFKEGERTRFYRNFTAIPTRFWESKRTHIRFPVSWRFEIPEISATITVDALTDDQEIPLFGYMRAFWEGVATATGIVSGRRFTANARLELQGYGYIFDFNQYLQFHSTRIDDCIRSFFPPRMTPARYRQFAGTPRYRHETTACNAVITAPVWDLLSRKKKYWRPVFSTLMLEALGVSSEKYRMLLSVVPELTHTGTLIIDDIEDNATTRRGDACIHKKYGIDVAVNAANTLYFLPSVLYGWHPCLTDQQRLEFYNLTLDMFIKGHFGQAQDIFWTKNLSSKNLAAWSSNHLPEKILQMYTFKTASPAIAAAKAACILAGADKRTRNACVSFASALGVSFQIMNDIHCFTGSQDAGDGRYDDLASGKLTYVIVRALDLLGTRESSRLCRILCSRHLRSNPKSLSEGIGLVRKSGALDECTREASSIIEDEWMTFSQVLPPSEPKMMLRVFSRNLVAPP
ncbi:MAG: polyprenyl synthetase family protein [Methanoregula sp.]|nr:MAG: polyprenyl synthetase family protein [Methanoregula sp.]